MTHPFTLDPPGDDPLGVLTDCAAVVAAGAETGVRLDPEAAAAFAEAHRDAPPPEHSEDTLHLTGLPPERFCNYLLALEALNFCFWDEPPRWRVTYRGATHDGYWALAAALHRAVEQDGARLWDAAWLAGLDRETLAHLLRGEGRPPPLMAERLAHLREAGRVLLERWEGQFARLIASARGDAPALVRCIVSELPSFRDEARWRGRPVRFYKRAQICVADLARMLPGDPLGRLEGLERLTAFADYRVPQVMRKVGVLRLAPALAGQIDAGRPLAAGSEPEVAIRAATVWGCEWIARALGELRGIPVSPADVDYLLWSAGQDKRGLPPYHRARTVFY